MSYPPITFPSGVTAVPIALDAPRAYHLPNWGRMSDPERLKFLRSVAEQRGRDPRIRELAFRILKDAGVDQREYEKQAAALLRWVQQNIAYLNEPGEILQDPLYTLNKKAGDCDDLSSLLASLYEAVRLEWRYVLSGEEKGTRRKIRFIERSTYPMPAPNMSHIYLTVGWPPFRPTTWRFAETTIKDAPLGWDIIAHVERGGGPILPEMASSTGPAGVPPVQPLAGVFRAFAGPGNVAAHVFDLLNPATSSPPPASAAPASMVAAGSGIAATAAASAAGHKQLVQSIVIASIVGVVTTVSATVVLDWLRQHQLVPSPVTGRPVHIRENPGRRRSRSRNRRR